MSPSSGGGAGRASRRAVGKAATGDSPDSLARSPLDAGPRPPGGPRMRPARRLQRLGWAPVSASGGWEGMGRGRVGGWAAIRMNILNISRLTGLVKQFWQPYSVRFKGKLRKVAAKASWLYSSQSSGVELQNGP